MTKKELLAKMEFMPWEGPFYQKGFFGKKVLIVGESYYEDPEWTNNPDNFPYASINAIQKHIFGWNQSTLSTFTSMILGKFNSVTIEDRAAFWNSAVYYNFIQAGLRQQATDNSEIPNDWLKNGKQILGNLLSVYKPDVTIMFSKQIWKHYADYKGTHYSKEYKEHMLLHSSVTTFDLEDSENTYHIVGIYHPSRLFSIEAQQEVSEFLRERLQLFD